jgi:hypothetical protein
VGYLGCAGRNEILLMGIRYNKHIIHAATNVMFLHSKNCKNFKEENARFEVLTALLLKMQVFLDVTLSKNSSWTA